MLSYPVPLAPSAPFPPRRRLSMNSKHYLVFSLAALVAGLAWFTNFIQIHDLQFQVEALQSQPQGYSDVVIMAANLDSRGHQTRRLERLELAPGAKALVIIHTNYTGSFDLFVQESAAVEILDGFGSSKLTSKSPITMTTEERHYTTRWDAQVFSPGLLGTVDSQNTWFVEVSNPGLDQKVFRVVAQATR